MSGTLARMSARLDSAVRPAAMWTRSPRRAMLGEMEPANDVVARDPHVERAVDAMRAAPSKRWTVASLAKLAGISRAPFARRFREATGTSPLRWLTAHRLELARARLAAGDASLTLAAIAFEVGYATDFALSKAFKRLFGVAPAIFRREFAGIALTPARAPARLVPGASVPVRAAA